MKNYIQLCKCDWKRVLCTPRFPLAVLGYWVLILWGLYDEIIHFTPHETSLVYILAVLKSVDLHMTYLLFAAMTSTLLFCADWENRYFRFLVMRGSKQCYAQAKATVVFFSALVFIVLAEGIPIVAASAIFPVWQPGEEAFLGTWRMESSVQGAWLSIVFSLLCEGLCSGMLNVFALWFSTKLPNAFVAIMLPFLTYQMLSIAAASLRLPNIFYISILEGGRLLIAHNPWESCAVTILIFGTFTWIAGQLFVQSCRRRIEDG